MSAYLQALSATDAGNASLVEKGSDTESRAIRQFIDLLVHFEADQLKEGVSGLYAEDAFFRDTFTELNQAREIEDYLVRSARAVDQCVFDVHDVAENNGNYYFRWTMSLRLDRYKDQPADLSVGMSHIRFNQDGKVIFHQDYWDAANIHEKFPVAGDAQGRFSKKRVDEA